MPSGAATALRQDLVFFNVAVHFEDQLPKTDELPVEQVICGNAHVSPCAPDTVPWCTTRSNSRNVIPKLPPRDAKHSPEA